MRRPYDTDLAYIHDVGFGEFARRSSPFLIDLLRRAGVRGAFVVDLGCGSGITARALRAAGHAVLGIDLSRAMIARARRTAPAARFRVASLWRTSLPRCDAVISIGECLSYRFDPARRDLGPLFRRIHRALRPGGLLVFDLLGPDAPTGSRLAEGRDWLVHATTTRDGRADEMVRRIIGFRRVGRTWRRHDEIHRLALRAPGEVAAQLRDTGFAVRRLGGYGDLRFRPGQHGFLARRK